MRQPDRDRTLLIVKPDAVRNNDAAHVLALAVDRIAARIENMAMGRASEDFWRGFYAALQGRPFFDELVAFMASGPVVAAELRGLGAVADLRELLGTTDPR